MGLAPLNMRRHFIWSPVLPEWEEMYFSAQWFESSCCGGSASFIWQLFWKNGVRHLISFNYARVPTLHVWVRWEFEEDTDLFVLDGRVSKKLGMVPCGCVRMKVSPLGPEFSYLAIRRHTSQITHIRLDSRVFHIGSCGRQTFMSNVWMNADDGSIMNLDLDFQYIITVNCRPATRKQTDVLSCLLK